MDEGKSRRPLDTPFRQQTLKAWRPILTPKVVVLTFFLVGCLFIPIGCVIISESGKVVEVESGAPNFSHHRPTQPRAPALVCWRGAHPALSTLATGDYHAECCVSNCEATDGTRVDRNPCTINLTVPEEMTPPIFMYYKLTDFYQNHRRYVKSRSDAQLRGVEVRARLP